MKTLLTRNLKPKIRNHLLILFCTVVLFAGCVDYKEEIWFNRDMSGTITMDFTIGEMFVDLSEEAERTDNIFTEEGIRNRFSAVEGLAIISSEVYTVDENRIIRIALKFDSLESFRKISNATKKTDFLGAITLSTTPDGNISFSRTISLSDSTIKSYAVYDEMLNKRFWISRIHFPGYIISANAPEENIDDKTGNTVIWAYSIAILTKGPQTMNAVFTSRSSRNMFHLAIAAVVFLAVFGVFYIMLGKGKEEVRS